MDAGAVGGEVHRASLSSALAKLGYRGDRRTVLRRAEQPGAACELRVQEVVDKDGVDAR